MNVHPIQSRLKSTAKKVSHSTATANKERHLVDVLRPLEKRSCLTASTTMVYLLHLCLGLVKAAIAQEPLPER
jgi:hypothetical protein